ncbi:unnamed protein product [Alternaria alternata]
MAYQDIDMGYLLNIPATMPADIDDCEVQENIVVRPSTRPTQMSVTMFKLRLFRLSSRLCRQLSDRMDRILLTSLDAEIAEEQQRWDSTFLIDGSPSLLDTSTSCILDDANGVADSAPYRAVFNAAVHRIESLQNLSSVYQKAYPVLRHLQ